MQRFPGFLGFLRMQATSMLTLGGGPVAKSTNESTPVQIPTTDSAPIQIPITNSVSTKSSPGSSALMTRVEGVSMAQMEVLGKILGIATTKAIFKLLDPAHKGYYRRSLGGWYTEPVESSVDQKKVHEVLGDIYGKFASGKARTWHSTNCETNQIWIGVPLSTPTADKAKHTKRWLSAQGAQPTSRPDLKRKVDSLSPQAARDRAARQKLAMNETIRRRQVQEGERPATQWSSLIVQTNQKSATEMEELFQKRDAAYKEAQANPPKRTYTTTFKLRKAASPAVVAAKSAPALLATLPPHEMARLARENI